jgi:hypothetical protein
MIEFLLLAILVAVCRPLQQLLGAAVLVVIALWIFAPPAPEVARPPAVEEVVLPSQPELPAISPAPVPDRGTGIDVRPARPYRQQ